MTKSATSQHERAKSGDFTLVDPLDYILLGLLHNEGELYAGLYPLGDTTAHIRKKLTQEQQQAVTTGVLAARLKAMENQGLVVQQHSGSAEKRVWQRTEVGAKTHKEWLRQRGDGDVASG